MGSDDGSSAAVGQVDRWHHALDFVEHVAGLLHLSGWSLGIAAGGALHTYTRGFSVETCARYAVLPLDVALPGPVTYLERRSQYFSNREDAHRRFPKTREIDDGTRHDAAATLVVRGRDETVALGYLALHFPGPRDFDARQRGRFERLSDTIAAVTPPRRTSRATTRATSSQPYDGAAMTTDRDVVADAMRAHQVRRPSSCGPRGDVPPPVDGLRASPASPERDTALPSRGHSLLR